MIPAPAIPDVSVVVASRGRPDFLARCLAALRLQTHPRIEVILVADPAGLAVRPDLPIKRIAFDQPNLPMARNLGIKAAVAPVVAFIDDDAIAEPCWAAALAGAFIDPQVIAATGDTLGPDGVRWQARAEWITADGVRPLGDNSRRLWLPEVGGTLSTIGTNAAFRRDVLLEIGGFDPLFAYFRDESDLNLRLAAAFPDRASAYDPRARVIHLAAPGVVRAGGAPSDLHILGRSEAIFARRHGAAPGWQARFRASQRKRLLRAMVAGRLDPLHLRGLLASLDVGLAEGEALSPTDQSFALSSADDRDSAFLPFGTRHRQYLAIAGWHWQRRRLRAQAAEAVAAGKRVSLMLWSPGFLAHCEGFHADGWWERHGGSWGPATPQEGKAGFRTRQKRQAALFEYWRGTRKEGER